MNKTETILLEQYFKFIGITTPKKKNRIVNLLSYCKEIRDTAYPMKNSNVTELEIVEFTARKEKKDLISINGSLMLSDGERRETRAFEAYIIEEESEATVFLDITRLCVNDEPKMIRTTDKITEDAVNIISVTSYAGLEATEKKTFSSEFPKKDKDDYYMREKVRQISAL